MALTRLFGILILVSVVLLGGCRVQSVAEPYSVVPSLEQQFEVFRRRSADLSCEPFVAPERRLGTVCVGTVGDTTTAFGLDGSDAIVQVVRTWFVAAAEANNESASVRALLAKRYGPEAHCALPSGMHYFGNGKQLVFHQVLGGGRPGLPARFRVEEFVIRDGWIDESRLAQIKNCEFERDED